MHTSKPLCCPVSWASTYRADIGIVLVQGAHVARVLIVIHDVLMIAAAGACAHCRLFGCIYTYSGERMERVSKNKVCVLSNPT